MTDKNIKIIHVAIISIIVIILGVAIFKILNWGTSSEELIGFDTGENFEYEDEDYIALVEPKYLEGRVDDGITTVVMLGDDTLSDYPDADGISAQVAQLADATIYDVSFANSRLASKSASGSFSDTYVEDAFSLPWLSLCIAANDYKLQDDKIDSIEGEDYQEALDVLKSIDFETVDIITILYGPHDYLDGTTITDPANHNNITAYSGALQESIRLIQEEYPHIRIIAVSPSFCVVEDEDGKPNGSDTYNTGHGILANYMIAAKTISVWSNVSYIDNIFGLPISIETSEDYLENHIHPNASTRTFIAQRIADMIKISVDLTE